MKAQRMWMNGNRNNREASRNWMRGNSIGIVPACHHDHSGRMLPDLTDWNGTYQVKPSVSSGGLVANVGFLSMSPSFMMYHSQSSNIFVGLERYYLKRVSCW